jgi:hypothetical protein
MNSDEKEILRVDEADVEAIETITDLSIERINNFTYVENHLETHEIMATACSICSQFANLKNDLGFFDFELVKELHLIEKNLFRNLWIIQ